MNVLTLCYRARLAAIKQKQAAAISDRARPLGRKLSLVPSPSSLECSANFLSSRSRPCSISHLLHFAHARSGALMSLIDTPMAYPDSDIVELASLYYYGVVY